VNSARWGSASTLVVVLMVLAAPLKKDTVDRFSGRMWRFMVIIVMGVSGSGKTMVGKELAAVLNFAFSDADEFHSEVNVAKMSKGIALSDSDRLPWLLSMRAAIEEWQGDERGHILACSALKASYRKILTSTDSKVALVYLKGSFELIKQRLSERKGHFFNPDLLRSQFAALEEPQHAIVVDISLNPREIVDVVLAALKVPKHAQVP
jgi:gluconokinase